MNAPVKAPRARGISHPANLVLICLLALGAAACGKKPETAAANEPGKAQAAKPADNKPAAAGKQSTASPPVSETVAEDDGRSASSAPVQPSLRLGGPANTPATSSRFKEGKNYAKLVPVQPTSVAPDKTEVVEVFWYGCSHCFTLDPAIESWRGKGKADYIEFVRVPAMWNEATRMHARVFYTAELLGKLEELHTPIFREIHVKGNPLNTVERITDFFRQHGVSADDFQKAFSSFAVENKLQRADFLNRRYRIESVPTVIVNGKYKTEVSMAGGEAQLFSLIDELAAHEHGG